MRHGIQMVGSPLGEDQQEDVVARARDEVDIDEEVSHGGDSTSMRLDIWLDEEGGVVRLPTRSHGVNISSHNWFQVGECIPERYECILWHANIQLSRFPRRWGGR